MKKLSIIAIILLILIAPDSVFVDDSDSSQNLYLEYKDSVFLISQSVFLKSALVKNIELFKKMESTSGIKLLDQYFPIASGTAFLVGRDGHLLTAYHVIKPLMEKEKRDYGVWSLYKYLAKYIVPGYLTRSEISQVFLESKSILSGSKIYLTAESTDRQIFIATLVDKNENQDLALLKIEPNKNKKAVPVEISLSVRVNVGDPVYAIGFPLTWFMSSISDDFKPTITNGIISALRDDKWGVQHTASINPGNSGGPLFNKNGELVGVNIGLLTNANNIYFAISSRKLYDWLVAIKQFDLVE